MSNLTLPRFLTVGELIKVATQFEPAAAKMLNDSPVLLRARFSSKDYVEVMVWLAGEEAIRNKAKEAGVDYQSQAEAMAEKITAAYKKGDWETAGSLQRELGELAEKRKNELGEIVEAAILNSAAAQEKFDFREDVLEWGQQVSKTAELLKKLGVNAASTLVLIPGNDEKKVYLFAKSYPGREPWEQESEVDRPGESKVLLPIGQLDYTDNDSNTSFFRRVSKFVGADDANNSVGRVSLFDSTGWEIAKVSANGKK